MSGLNHEINSSIEIVIYRIIQECVNNVIKHAEANELYITVAQENNNIDIMVEDNGKGFDSQDKKRREGIGLKNMRTRVEYLNGEMEIDSKPNHGTVVNFHIPLLVNEG